MAITFVRHGHVADVTGRCIGRTDVALSQRGREAMARLAQRWSVPPAALWTSDLARATASARVLGAGWTLTPISDPRLREVDFGDWDGLAWDEIHRRDAARFGAWAADWVQQRPPRGEAFIDLVARVGAWLADVRATAADAEIVAVAHAGSIRAAVCALGCIDAERAFEVPIGYAEAVRVELDREMPVVTTPRACFSARWMPSLTKNVVPRAIRGSGPGG